MSSQTTIQGKKSKSVSAVAKKYWAAHQEDPINYEYYVDTAAAGPAAGQVRSDVFKKCMRLSEKHPHYDQEKFHCTHQCILELKQEDGSSFTPPKFCYDLFHCPKQTGNRNLYQTGRLSMHLRDVHGKAASKHKQESDDALVLSTTSTLKKRKQDTMMTGFFPGKLKLSTRHHNDLLYRQACVVMYGTGHHSLTETTDKQWKRMVEQFSSCYASTPPFLSRERLIQIIKIEFQNMQILIQKVLGDICSYHHGNRPLQLAHDTCTIDQTHFLGVGVQGVHVELGNVNLAIGCVEVGHDNREQSNMIRTIWQKMIPSLEFENAIGDAIQDYAALGVGRVS